MLLELALDPLMAGGRLLLLSREGWDLLEASFAVVRVVESLPTLNRIRIEHGRLLIPIKRLLIILILGHSKNRLRLLSWQDFSSGNALGLRSPPELLILRNLTGEALVVNQRWCLLVT